MQLINSDEVLGLAFTPDDPIDPACVREARIEAAQLRYIRPTFGDAMYQSMRMERYDLFVSQYIKPALAHFVRYELIGELAVRAGSRGVVRPSTEESSQTTSATRSDTGNRTESSTQELVRVANGQKTTSGTTGRKTTTRSTDTVASDETVVREGKDQRTVTVADTSRTTVQNSTSEQTETAAPTSITLLEKNGTDQVSATKNTQDDTASNQEEARNTTRTDTTDGTQEVAGTESSTATNADEQNDLTTRKATVGTTGTTENSGHGDTTRTTLRAATSEEWQLLSRQALRDARTFLRYAVEYVEANRELFPDYAPTSGLGSAASRRCIGGIIL